MPGCAGLLRAALGESQTGALVWDILAKSAPSLEVPGGPRRSRGSPEVPGGGAEVPGGGPRKSFERGEEMGRWGGRDTGAQYIFTNSRSTAERLLLVNAIIFVINRLR